MVNLEWRIDKERGKEVALKVIGMMQRKVFPFDVPGRFPDAISPYESLRGENSFNFLQGLYNFYAGFLDYRVDSHLMYTELRQLVLSRGIETLSETNRNGLDEKLRIYFPKSIGDSRDNPRRKKIVDALLRNNLRLQANYCGDPRNIKTDDVEETQKIIEGFELYGIQKAALLTKNMVRFGIWDFSPYEIPVKMDRHAARIFVGTGVVKFSVGGGNVEYEDLDCPFPTDKIKKGLRKAFMEITREEKISAIDLNDGIWLIGNMLCRKNDHVYCNMNCDLGCESRPKSDRSGSNHHLGTDHRKNPLQLNLF